MMRHVLLCCLAIILPACDTPSAESTSGAIEGLRFLLAERAPTQQASAALGALIGNIERSGGRFITDAPQVALATVGPRSSLPPFVSVYWVQGQFDIIKLRVRQTRDGGGFHVVDYEIPQSERESMKRTYEGANFFNMALVAEIAEDVDRITAPSVTLKHVSAADVTGIGVVKIWADYTNNVLISLLDSAGRESNASPLYVLK